MARLSRITVPGLPHHVTQRGNRRQALFTRPDDYALYRECCKAHGVSCWAYCLMPNQRPPRSCAANAGRAVARRRRGESALHCLLQQPSRG